MVSDNPLKVRGRGRRLGVTQKHWRARAPAQAINPGTRHLGHSNSRCTRHGQMRASTKHLPHEPDEAVGGAVLADSLLWGVGVGFRGRMWGYGSTARKDPDTVAAPTPSRCQH